MSQSSDESALRGATLYLDCFAGIAGDMMLGALLDLGVPESVVRHALGYLRLSDYELVVRHIRKGALMARQIEVLEPGGSVDHDRGHDHDHDHHSHEHTHTHAHRHDEDDDDEPQEHVHPDIGAHAHVHYGQIRAMIVGAGPRGLASDVIERALAMFDRLAVVEAELHGVPVSDVAFHEVGAVDSIVDIVGTAAALSWLRPRRVVSRSVPLGGGMVRTAHGLLPVPAPATLALLKGVPVEAGGPPFELTTPTGAVILAANVQSYGAMPAMQVVAVGHGAGTRELADRPNLLRVVAGTEVAAAVPCPTGECLVIEANIDDMNPQLYEPLVESLFREGARDAWLTPVHMKKGRPGVVVSVLCDRPQREALSRVLLRESTTLGVRVHAVERRILDRTSVDVETEFGTVSVKLGRDPATGAVWNVAPEFSTCVERARAQGVPVKSVVAAAIAAFQRL